MDRKKRRAPKFEVYPSASSPLWFWRLRAPNGEIVASGEGYCTKAACLRGVKAVKKYVPVAEVALGE